MRKGRGVAECYEQCTNTYGSSDSYSACAFGCSAYRCIGVGRKLKETQEKIAVVVDPVTDIKKTPDATRGKRPVISVTAGAQDKVTVVKEKVPAVLKINNKTIKLP